MSITSRCPDLDKLRQVVRGGLSRIGEEELESHLLLCSSCFAEARRLAADAPLLPGDTAVPWLPDDSVPTRPQVRDLLNRLRRLHPPSVTATSNPSAGSEEATMPPDSPSAEATSDHYAFLAPAQAADELGRLGPYRVLKVLGSGGMGVVFLAEDPQLLRPVALKAMLPHLAAGDSARQRFLREARSTAAVKHDHVVSIYHVSEDRGVPFLAMEFLEGESLEDRLHREARLPLAMVLRIGREAALGLAAAHKRGLLHRDVKPANLWLEAESGRVKVLDFGLARAADGDAQLTQQGAIVGTPAYMAPEQGRGQAVDARCDLFSLGCVLYRLATGRRAYGGTDTISTLMSVATDEPPPPQAINPAVSRELSDLIMRLLAKKPEDRPASAQAVADALQACERAAIPTNDRTDQWIPTVSSAKPQTASRRPRWGLVIAVALVLLAVLPLGYFFGGAVLRLVSAKGEPVVEKEDPKKDPQPAEAAISPMDTLDPAQIPGSERFDWQPKELVAVIGEHRQRHWGAIVSLAISPDGKQAASSGAEGQVRLWDVATQQELPGIQFGGWVFALAYSPDGKRIACGGGALVQIWDLSGVKPKLHTVVTDEALVYHGYMAFASDGKSLVYNCTVGDVNNRGGVWLWDVSNKQPQCRAHYPQGESASFSPDGKTLVVVHADDRSIRLYDLTAKEPKERAVLPGKEGKARLSVTYPPIFAPDGRLAAYDPEYTLRLWDVSGQEPQMQAVIKHTDLQLSAFASNDTRMASTNGSVIQMWRKEGLDYVAMPGVVAKIDQGGWLCSSPDGNTLVTVQGNGAVRFWEVGEESIVEKNPLKPQPFLRSDAIVILPHGPALAAFTESSQLRVWRLGDAAPAEVALFGAAPPKLHPLAVSPDGKTLATAEERTPVQLWHIEGATARETEIFKGVNVMAGRGAFAADGKILALATGEGISLWDLAEAAPKEFATLRRDKSDFQNVALTPDGRTLVSNDYQGVRLWNIADGTPTERKQVLEGIPSIAVAPDGKTLALGALEDVLFFNTDDGTPRKPTPLHVGRLESVSFSPDGQTVVVAGRVGLAVWHVATGRKLREWTFPGDIHWAAYAPDGRHLITANSNGTIYVLRLAGPPGASERKPVASRRSVPLREPDVEPFHVGLTPRRSPLCVTAS